MAAFTGTLWRATTEQSRLTGEAVEISRRSLTDWERPYVIVVKMHGDIAVPPANRSLVPHVWLTFRNYGRTPANVEGCVIFARVLDHIPTELDGPEATAVTSDSFDID